MKVLKKEELHRRNQVEHTNTEKRILSTLSNPFIVKMYYSFQSVDKLYMCLEYINGGELFFHLKVRSRNECLFVCLFVCLFFKIENTNAL